MIARTSILTALAATGLVLASPVMGQDEQAQGPGAGQELSAEQRETMRP